MIWPMRDARLWGTRLWDGFCEKHAYERHVDLHRLEKRGERSWPVPQCCSGDWWPEKSKPNSSAALLRMHI
jgi:hypothetical protein